MSALLQTALHSQLTGSLLLLGASRSEPAKVSWLRVTDQHPAGLIEAANANDIALDSGFAQTPEGKPLAPAALKPATAAYC